VYQKPPELVFSLYHLQTARNPEICGTIVNNFELEPALQLFEEVMARNERRNGRRGQELRSRHT
jgi:hypothetical protein